MKVYLLLKLDNKTVLPVVADKISPHPWMLGKVVLVNPREYCEKGTDRGMPFVDLTISAKSLTIESDDIQLYYEGVDDGSKYHKPT